MAERIRSVMPDAIGRPSKPPLVDVVGETEAAAKSDVEGGGVQVPNERGQELVEGVGALELGKTAEPAKELGVKNKEPTVSRWAREMEEEDERTLRSIQEYELLDEDYPPDDDGAIPDELLDKMSWEVQAEVLIDGERRAPDTDGRGHS
jgi:hypothetical protein